MAELAAVAAVVGITDVTIRSIVSCYDFIKKLDGAPAEVVKVRNETAAVMKCLEGLGFLKSASQQVQDKVRALGLTESVELCGKACKSLEKDLRKWTETGVETVIARLLVVSHKSRIGTYRADICAAKGTITLAISEASLFILSEKESTTSSEEKERTEILKKQLKEVTQEAQREREEAERLRVHYEEVYEQNEDSDSRIAMDELTKQKSAFERLLMNASIAAEDVRELSTVNVAVGEVLAEGMGSIVAAGVSKDVVDKVKSARVRAGKLTATGGGKIKLGVQ